MSNERSPQLLDQTGRNIDLAFRPFNEAIEDDAAFDAIPNGGTLILLPYDDPKLALRNLAMALRAADAGTATYLRRVGAPAARSDDPYARWQSALFNVRLAASLGSPSQLSIEYDPIADAQVFDFSTGQHSTFRLSVCTGIALLVDLGSLEVVGYSILRELVEHLGPFSHEAPEPSDSDGHDSTGDRPVASSAFVDDLALAA